MGKARAGQGVPPRGDVWIQLSKGTLLNEREEVERELEQGRLAELEIKGEGRLESLAGLCMPGKHLYVSPHVMGIPGSSRNTSSLAFRKDLSVWL